MKLLITTEKVDRDDAIFGFMHGWIAEFAKHCERVTVICLQEGSHNLPAHVVVRSLGKERSRSRLKYAFNFYKHIWRERRHYESVFVHMNPEYVLLGGIFWRLWGKTIGLWYAHGHTPLILRLAAPLAHVIFTSTASGCRLRSKKIRIVGQGIDVEKFVKGSRPASEIFRIMSVGRVSPVKGYETLLKAAAGLAGEGVKFQVEIIGAAGTPAQEAYVERLKNRVRETGLKGIVHFRGAVPNRNLLPHLQSADLFVNMSRTGSLDKAIAEAMACELPVVTSNEALREVLGVYQETLMYPAGDGKALADRIRYVTALSAAERATLGRELREIVVKHHCLTRFVEKIIAHSRNKS